METRLKSQILPGKTRADERAFVMQIKEKFPNMTRQQFETVVNDFSQQAYQKQEEAQIAEQDTFMGRLKG